MKTRIIFIILWLFFIFSLTLCYYEIPGGLIGSISTSFVLTFIYFLYSRNILLVPKEKQKVMWLIYLSGIAWGYSILPILFIFNGYPGSGLLSFVGCIFLIIVLALTIFKRQPLSNSRLFNRMIIHSVILLILIGVSYFYLK